MSSFFSCSFGFLVAVRCVNRGFVKKLCQKADCFKSILVPPSSHRKKIAGKTIEETNGLFYYIFFYLIAPEVTASHGREGMSELTQQEGYQVAGTRKTIIHKSVFSHTLLPPRHRRLITFQNSAINWESIDQTLVLVADISYSTHISYEQDNHFINCCW